MLSEEILNKHRAAATRVGSDPSVVDSKEYRDMLVRVLRAKPKIKHCLLLASNYERKGQTELARIYRKLAREV